MKKNTPKKPHGNTGNRNAAKPKELRRIQKQFSVHPNTLAWIKLLSCGGNIPASTIVADAVYFYALHVLDEDVAERECRRQAREEAKILLESGVISPEEYEEIRAAVSRES